MKLKTFQKDFFFPFWYLMGIFIATQYKSLSEYIWQGIHFYVDRR